MINRIENKTELISFGEIFHQIGGMLIMIILGTYFKFDVWTVFIGAIIGIIIMKVVEIIINTEKVTECQSSEER